MVIIIIIVNVLLIWTQNKFSYFLSAYLGQS